MPGPAPADVPPGPGMVRVPAGAFVQGRARPERPDEAPPHKVRVRAFLLEETLVTTADFARFVARTGYRTTAERRGYGVGAQEGMNDWEWERIPGASFRRPFWEETPDTAAFLRADAPAVMVSWDDATAYCGHLGRRLPTEAEWEYAMRAGSAGTRYPWGDRPERSPGKLGLNYWQGASHRRNERRDGHVYVSPVRAFPPNAFGLYDPVGNVWQWTADLYAPDAYERAARAGAAQAPAGPPAGERRVVRGGSWWCGESTCEGNGLHYRGKSTPDSAYNNIGFRCAGDEAAAVSPAPARTPAAPPAAGSRAPPAPR